MPFIPALNLTCPPATSTVTPSAGDAPPPPRAPVSDQPGAAATPLDAFLDGLEPRPKPAVAYGDTFGWTRAGVVTIDEQTGLHGPFAAFAEAGKPFVVRYLRDPEMLGFPRDVARIELRYRVDGGPVRKALVCDGTRSLHDGSLTFFPARIAVPPDAKGDLEYWFKIEGRDGRVYWDSDYGRNFRANIVPQGGAVLRFDEDWNEAVGGALVAGGTLRLAYDVDRIRPLLDRTHHHGVPTWSVLAHLRFDDGPVIDVPLTAPRHGDYGATTDIQPIEGVVEIPVTARRVTVWFSADAYGAPTAWDSDFARNYRFAIAPPADG